MLAQKCRFDIQREIVETRRVVPPFIEELSQDLLFCITGGQTLLKIGYLSYLENKTCLLGYTHQMTAATAW